MPKSGLGLPGGQSWLSSSQFGTQTATDNPERLCSRAPLKAGQTGRAQTSKQQTGIQSHQKIKREMKSNLLTNLGEEKRKPKQKSSGFVLDLNT